MVENGERSLTPEMLDRLRSYYDVDPENLPVREPHPMSDSDYARELANLGYPGFAHRKEGKPFWNPTQLALSALSCDVLDRRVAEALPWLVLRYWHADWTWALTEAKGSDLQNRLGFAVTLARRLAEKMNLSSPNRLREFESQVERSRLVREDTFCNETMTVAERNWLRTHSSPEARHWNLLSDMRPEHLIHVD